MKSDTASIKLKVDLINEYSVPSGVLGIAAADSGSESLLVSCMDGYVYDYKTEERRLRKITRHTSYASSVAWLPQNDGVVVSSGYDGKIIWSDFKSAKRIQQTQAHGFWSWQMKCSETKKLVGSATGQYLSGGYKYEPAPEKEPSIKIYNAETRELISSLSHLPPVLSLAFSPNDKYVAAGNLMGDIKLWDIKSGKEILSWNSPDFTSWGIIKSHHYIGGIFDMCFSPDSNRLSVCGMGPMRDPMAGNGKQTWQTFDVSKPSQEPEIIAEIQDQQRGRGLMESICYHPSGRFFVMAGRLAQGQWNVSFFDSSTGELIHSLNNKIRITSIDFSTDGQILFLGGTKSQGKKNKGKWRDYGSLLSYKLKVV